MSEETTVGLESPSQADRTFDQLLAFMRDRRGFDFTGYRRDGLRRRIDKRLDALGLDSYDQLVALLDDDPGEFGPLFNSLLVGFTGFFRNPETWEFVRREVVPTIASCHDEESLVRVWCPGCATGEEAYSIGMLLAEEFGLSGGTDRFRIFATDIDETAVREARRATYLDREVARLPDSLRRRYTKTLGEDSHQIVDPLRTSIVFGDHNLVSDPPLSKLDMISCRNVLMYFEPELQRQILERFTFGLRDGGYLLVGHPERPPVDESLFEPEASDTSLYRKTRARGSIEARRSIWSMPLSPPAANESDQAPADKQELLKYSFRKSFDPRLLVDADGEIVALNRRAESILDLSYNMIGRSYRDLEIAHRPVSLPPLVEQALEQRKPIVRPDVEWAADGEHRVFDLRVVPLFRADSTRLGVSISYRDATRRRGLEEKVQEAHRELEQAEERCRSHREELETSNEELLTTNHALESSNQELRARNEELDAVNEELRSTNQELQTLNGELRNRTTQLREMQSIADALLAMAGEAIVLVDAQRKVRIWNANAGALLGVSTEEAVDRSFQELALEFGKSQLEEAITGIVSGAKDDHQLRLADNEETGSTYSAKCAPVEIDGERGAVLVVQTAPSPP